jgi:hypothetical protein
VHEFERGLLDYFHGTAKDLRAEFVADKSFKKIGDKMLEAMRDYKASFVAASSTGKSNG